MRTNSKLTSTPVGLSGFLSLIIIISVAFLLLSGCSCSKETTSTKSKTTQSATTEARVTQDIEEFIEGDLSPDQKELVSMLGYPDEFVIMFDEGNNNLRIETWIYEAMESSFTFLDGKFDNRDTSIPADLASDNYDIKPEDFIYGMSPGEVNNLIGEDGEEIINPETGLKILVFGEGIIFCTFNPYDTLINIARVKKIVSKE